MQLEYSSYADRQAIMQHNNQTHVHMHEVRDFLNSPYILSKEDHTVDQ